MPRGELATRAIRNIARTHLAREAQRALPSHANALLATRHFADVSPTDALLNTQQPSIQQRILPLNLPDLQEELRRSKERYAALMPNANPSNWEEIGRVSREIGVIMKRVQLLESDKQLTSHQDVDMMLEFVEELIPSFEGQTDPEHKAILDGLNVRKNILETRRGELGPRIPAIDQMAQILTAQQLDQELTTRIERFETLPEEITDMPAWIEKEQLAHEIRVLTARRGLLQRDQNAESFQEIDQRLADIEREKDMVSQKRLLRSDIMHVDSGTRRKSAFARRGLQIRRKLLLDRKAALEHSYNSPPVGYEGWEQYVEQQLSGQADTNPVQYTGNHNGIPNVDPLVPPVLTVDPTHPLSQEEREAKKGELQTNLQENFAYIEPMRWMELLKTDLWGDDTSVRIQPTEKREITIQDDGTVINRSFVGLRITHEHEDGEAGLVMGMGYFGSWLTIIPEAIQSVNAEERQRGVKAYFVGQIYPDGKLKNLRVIPFPYVDRKRKFHEILYRAALTMKPDDLLTQRLQAIAA